MTGLPLAQSLLAELLEQETLVPFLTRTAQEHNMELQEVLTLPVQVWDHHIQCTYTYLQFLTSNRYILSASRQKDLTAYINDW